MLSLICKQCGKPFKKSKLASRKFFCSVKCRDRNCYLRLEAHLHAPIEKICETCHNPFTAGGINRTRQRYCSDKCREQSPDERAYQLSYRRSPQGSGGHKRRRLKLMNYLGGPKCRMCGCEIYYILHFDHIKPEHGREDRERIKGTGSFISYYSRHVDEAKEKLQVLCSPCNQARKRKY